MKHQFFAGKKQWWKGIGQECDQYDYRNRTRDKLVYDQVKFQSPAPEQWSSGSWRSLPHCGSWGNHGGSTIGEWFIKPQFDCHTYPPTFELFENCYQVIIYFMYVFFQVKCSRLFLYVLDNMQEDVSRVMKKSFVNNIFFFTVQTKERISEDS